MSSNKIAILYGSETGNAADFAAILSHHLHRLHFAHSLSSMGDYPAADILKCRYMFVISSTTGQGDLPRNVHEMSYGEDRTNTLWSVLKKKNLPNDLLDHLNIAFFGLGDSSYPKFNYAIRKLHQRMVVQLGATEIFERLEADDISMAGSNRDTGLGIESVYFEFEKRILQHLKEKFPNRKVNGEVLKREELSEEIYLEPKTYLKMGDTSNMRKENAHEPKFMGDYSISNGKIIKNLRITSEEHFQDVRQLTFKQDDIKPYSPGDTIAIYPTNTDEDVQRFLEVQTHWLEIADEPLSFTDGIPNSLNDGGCIENLTLRNLLKYHCDFNSIPKPSFFMKIWTFATDVSRMERGEEQCTQQREKLHEFAFEQDMQDLYDYCNRPRRSILEVLEDFLSIRLPWKYVIDYMPVLKPRLFSISSSKSNSEIELTVAIVKYKTILRKLRRGVCTNYISKLRNEDTIRYKVINNSLHLNKQLEHNRDIPCILISPGVGIAPMMSLIRSDICNNVHLFFGNRVKDCDFLYRSELEQFDKSGKIKLYTCFSRDEINSPELKYVQDILWEKKDLIANLIIDNQAVIYLCGSSGKMPIQVRITIVEILKKSGHFKDDKEAETYLKDMEKNNRYFQETW
ncbi:hypothetical protein TPHA_0M01460 [Tetrapisispora phaffii CBS 4417]|uniref:NADPH-dependent diflavin oxidoreductase 1 n=1 Tax=Tetrapisispora phaffii (strain ATCC 24235 / CBS 4417 / NBRC 1672 / NRRL Y-8282 / UCD 70-5) TaxID=1071381 RepID=G8C0K6_TETPH|nr:hypothetical protein TPHA_0M01460 [Tetrapisispora phaffii CBS 4417]CCE65721.1 hypothetical protein TPHA_0M01460 [Tetrapisispora phaffii CBS 4417]